MQNPLLFASFAIVALFGLFFFSWLLKKQRETQMSINAQCYHAYWLIKIQIESARNRRQVQMASKMVDDFYEEFIGRATRIASYAGHLRSLLNNKVISLQTLSNA